MELTSPSCTVATTDDVFSVDEGDEEEEKEVGTNFSRPGSFSTVWRTKRGTSTVSVAMVVVDRMVVTKKKKDCCELVGFDCLLIEIKSY